MPRELTEKLGDFKLRDNLCNVENAKFLGQRYWAKSDPALSLIFDKNGIIAGVQTSFPKSQYTPFPYQENTRFVDDGDYWALTTYFVDPNTICGDGRTHDQLKNDGTGTGLWLQYGSDPIKDSIHIPMLESDVKNTDWKFGKCFYTMGNHYWYNVTKDMPCDHFMPNCLLYNKGKLNAFCFSVNADFTSPRYEHPTTNVLDKFIDPVPGCMYTDPSFKKLSTMHVYFDDEAEYTSWC